MKLSDPVFGLAMGCLLGLALSTCHEARAASPICNTPVPTWQDQIAAAPGYFNGQVMTVADEVIGEHIRSHPDKYPGWRTEAPPLPKFFISDCYRWQKHMAVASYNGDIRMIGELVGDTSVQALRVAIHERMHQWQPRVLDQLALSQVEYVVQAMEAALTTTVLARLKAVKM